MRLHQAGRAGDQGEAEGVVEQGDAGVEEEVDEVVAERLQLVDQVVEPEGQDRQGPVRLVAAGVRQGRAPEVVGQDVGPGRVP